MGIEKVDGYGELSHIRLEVYKTEHNGNIERIKTGSVVGLF